MCYIGGTIVLCLTTIALGQGNFQALVCDQTTTIRNFNIGQPQECNKHIFSKSKECQVNVYNPNIHSLIIPVHASALMIILYMLYEYVLATNTIQCKS